MNENNIDYVAIAIFEAYDSLSPQPITEGVFGDTLVTLGITADTKRIKEYILSRLNNGDENNFYAKFNQIKELQEQRPRIFEKIANELYKLAHMQINKDVSADRVYKINNRATANASLPHVRVKDYYNSKMGTPRESQIYLDYMDNSIKNVKAKRFSGEYIDVNGETFPVLEDKRYRLIRGDIEETSKRLFGNIDNIATVALMTRSDAFENRHKNLEGIVHNMVLTIGDAIIQFAQVKELMRMLPANSIEDVYEKYSIKLNEYARMHEDKVKKDRFDETKDMYQKQADYAKPMKVEDDDDELRTYVAKNREENKDRRMSDEDRRSMERRVESYQVDTRSNTDRRRDEFINLMRNRAGQIIA